ncbi:MAG TPA: M24 family metallopeptidase [Gemmatimonadaceae bacterium]|nr:M24 family metallopeptidase [Gemmatimonadaceae bacterium]
MALVASVALSTGGDAQVRDRPFGTVKKQAAQQQAWLEKRLKTILPASMRRHGVDMWVIPMREYNEDPVFRAIVSPTTFAARRRTIYVFFDRCAREGRNDPGDGSCIERIALGGTSQGGLYEVVRAVRTVEAPVAGRQAELWGDDQWKVLRDVIERRNPRTIAINVSRTWAFADGLTAGEFEGMSEALAPWTARFQRSELLAVELLSLRLPEEEEFYRKLQALVWQLIQRMFSNEVVKPGVTRTSDLVWWWRQQVSDLGLDTWFQPSVDVQRPGVAGEQLGDDPVIQRGDVLHCDVGITALGLNTDTQHMAYVLREGESTVPEGLIRALRNANRFQDILFEEIRPGKSGNQVLAATRQRLRSEGLEGTMYSHPIGLHGHGAGPLIGLWDYQEGVPGRGDAPVLPNTWFSSELQVTTPVPEWGGQPVRVAQEEDFVIGADGRPRWAYQRQTEWHIIR